MNNLWSDNLKKLNLLHKIKSTIGELRVMLKFIIYTFIFFIVLEVIVVKNIFRWWTYHDIWAFGETVHLCSFMVFYGWVAWVIIEFLLFKLAGGEVVMGEIKI